jgi:hypothetical protein
MNQYIYILSQILHSNGITHFDLKSGNILMDDKGNLRICFGLFFMLMLYIYILFHYIVTQQYLWCLHSSKWYSCSNTLGYKVSGFDWFHIIMHRSNFKYILTLFIYNFFETWPLRYFYFISENILVLFIV